MATVQPPSDFHDTLNIQEQITRINEMQTNIQLQIAQAEQSRADFIQSHAAAEKLKTETRTYPLQIGAALLGAGAALFAAGMAFFNVIAT